jgi:transposase
LVQRATIVLLSDDGLSIADIAEQLELDRQRVRRWLRRYSQDGKAGLKDAQRSGRPPEIEPKVWQKAAAVVVQAPGKFGLPFARWSVRTLSAFLWERYGLEVSPASLSRFLRSMALKPHRLKYWLNPTDPDFDDKARRICRLYCHPPKGATVLSLDEKPGVQALRRRHPDRPMKPGRCRRMEFEYKRGGTRCIFAAFNIKTGQVVVRVEPNRKIDRVLAFLDLVAQTYKRGKLIIITDNISTRTGKAAKDWLRKHPRVGFVFTPHHGSWLNQVEIWFSILTKQCLRAQSFRSVRHLAGTIIRFTRLWNRERAKPFQWTYTGKVLAA